MKKSRNWPLVSFLISLAISAVLFIPDWEIAVQAKLSTFYQFVAGIGFPLLGIVVFSWSYIQAANSKSKRYKILNHIAIAFIVIWLMLTLYALFVGLTFGHALDKALNDSSY